MAYFTVVSNHGSYRATSHEFKLVFLHRTTVVAVDEDVIPKTCFNMFPFSELLNMTEDYDFLVVGEEKEYAKEGKIVKMIVLLTLRCELFGDYVNQVNHFLASGYVGQPVVVIQLAKVKFFRGQVGLQNVMYATQMLFNPDLPEVVEFRQSMIEQGVNGTQPLFIANEGKVVSLEDDFMRLTRKCTIEELQDNNQVLLRMEAGGILLVCVERIIVGEGIFLFFDREASYLLKKSCADLFTEVQRDASLTCGDTYPPIFQGLIGKKLLLKVDIKVRRICDDPTIITMFELPNYDADDKSTPKKEPDLHKSVPCGKGDIGIKEESSKTCIKSEKVAGTEFAALINGEDGKDEKTPTNDTVSDDLFAELDILLSSPEKETQVCYFVSHRRCCPTFSMHIANTEKSLLMKMMLSPNGKRNLNPQFEEAATVADGHGSKVAKVNGGVIEGVELSCYV
ncbi:hypothetical protein AHAS_Ahas14G0114300 [Arachis hypogaea]